MIDGGGFFSVFSSAKSISSCSQRALAAGFFRKKKEKNALGHLAAVPLTPKPEKNYTSSPFCLFYTSQIKGIYQQRIDLIWELRHLYQGIYYGIYTG